jgi:hypothetical protein
MHWSKVPAEKNVTSRVVIYALVDPFTEHVRYVGVTNRPLKERLAMHLDAPTNPKTRRWFEDLARAGASPIIRAIAATGADWQRDEQYWIAWFRVRGSELLNVHFGGMLDANEQEAEDAKKRVRAEARVGEAVTPWQHGLRSRVRAIIEMNELRAMKPKARRRAKKLRKIAAWAKTDAVGPARRLSAEEVARLTLTPPRRPRSK